MVVTKVGNDLQTIVFFPQKGCTDNSRAKGKTTFVR